MSEPTEYSQFISSVNYPAPLEVNKRDNNAQDWLFPTVCALCGGHGQRGRELCQGCEGDLPLIEAGCLQCGVPLPMQGLCGHCQRRPPAFARAVAAFNYLPPVDALIKRLKFKGDLHLAELIGVLMADRLGAPGIPLPDVLVPVPLHSRRLRERGFNQALELARPIARRLGVPLDWRHVIRSRATDPQSDLPAKLRSRNVKGAFSVAAGFTAQRVAIVDDVMTTGHTVNELALTLRRHGVMHVSVWVCARAVFGG